VNQPTPFAQPISTTGGRATFSRAGTIQLGGKRLRRGFLRRTRREARAYPSWICKCRTTKSLRKKIKRARPTQLNRSGGGEGRMSAGNPFANGANSQLQSSDLFVESVPKHSQKLLRCGLLCIPHPTTSPPVHQKHRRTCFCRAARCPPPRWNLTPSAQGRNDGRREIELSPRPGARCPFGYRGMITLPAGRTKAAPPTRDRLPVAATSAVRDS